MALLPTAKLCGATVKATDGEPLGPIHDLMIDSETGAIGYAVLAVGGVTGIGEKLFALPWGRIRADGDELTSTLTRAELDQLDGFDKDAWPTEADPRL